MLWQNKAKKEAKNMKNKAAKVLLYTAAAAAGLLLTVMGVARLAGLLLPQLPGAQRKNEAAAQRQRRLRVQKRGEGHHENG